jgi:very-short-patch-repair endonuclease
VDLDLRVMELASTQHGVVSRQQLLALGMSSRMVARWRRQGRLRLIHRGVYLVGAVLPLWASEQAALLASGPQAVLSHWTAARMVDLPVPGDVRSDVVHVSIPVSGGGRRRGIRAYRTDALHAAEVQRLRDMPVTNTSRTLLDLAPLLGRRGQVRRLEQLVAVALERRLVTEAELRRVGRRHPSSRGAGLLALVLDVAAVPRLARSKAEEALLRLIREAELPLPRMNVMVAAREVDFFWEAERLVVEVDGWRWHSSRNRFENDRERDARIVAAGCTVLRITARRIDRNPEAVAGRIAFMLGRLLSR